MARKPKSTKRTAEESPPPPEAGGWGRCCGAPGLCCCGSMAVSLFHCLSALTPFSSLFSFLGNWIRRFGYLEGEPNGSVLDYGRRMKREVTRGAYLDWLLWVQSFSPASMNFMCTFGAISPLQRLSSRGDQPEKTKNTFFFFLTQLKFEDFNLKNY